MIIDFDDNLVDKHALQLPPCLELFRLLLNPTLAKTHNIVSLLTNKHAFKLTPCLELFRHFLNPATVKTHKGGETPLCGIARVGLKGGQNNLEFNFEIFLVIEIG